MWHSDIKILKQLRDKAVAKTWKKQSLIGDFLKKHFLNIYATVWLIISLNSTKIDSIWRKFDITNVPLTLYLSFYCHCLAFESFWKFSFGLIQIIRTITWPYPILAAAVRIKNVFIVHIFHPHKIFYWFCVLPRKLINDQRYTNRVRFNLLLISLLFIYVRKSKNISITRFE